MGKKKELKEINLKLQCLIDILIEKESASVEKKEIEPKLQHLIDILIKIEKNTGKENRESLTNFENTPTYGSPLLSTTENKYGTILVGRSIEYNLDSQLTKLIDLKGLPLDVLKAKAQDSIKNHSKTKEVTEKKENK